MTMCATRGDINRPNFTSDCPLWCRRPRRWKCDPWFREGGHMGPPLQVIRYRSGVTRHAFSR